MIGLRYKFSKKRQKNCLALMKAINILKETLIFLF